MRLLERIILYLFPLLLLKKTHWEKSWLQQEKKSFLSSIRVFFGLAALAYFLHYFTVDRMEGLAPSELWMKYRFSMAGISLLCLGFYSTPQLYRFKYFKAPMMIACAIFCYFQTKTIVWYPKVPYLYSFAFVLISTIVLRSTLFKSVLFALILLVTITPPLVEAGQTSGMIISASMVTLIFVIYMKSKDISDLHLFIANQKNFDAQKKIIEINVEFTNQIKSFLPAEISKRLFYFVREQRMSVLQAIDEVLRPRQLNITCLFSDIRGFTKASGDLEGFVSKSLLPNIKATTIAVERFEGIPRKIGDLLFSYYDTEDFDTNLANVMKSAVEISNLNHEMNESLPEELRIKRYILVSGGEAVVGNLSGYDSTIEITAIGTPVNILSRIDEITKKEVLRQHITEGDIIITPNLLPALNRCFPGLNLVLIPLSAMNLKIRDFEHIEELYLLPLTKRNFQIIFKNSKTIDLTNINEMETKWAQLDPLKKMS